VDVGVGSGVLVCEGMGSVEGVGVKFIKFGPVIDVELKGKDNQ
jgi:hypothetical protein